MPFTRPKFKYGTASKIHLSGVTPALRKVFEKAIELVNFQIIDGIRTQAEAERNTRNGSSHTNHSLHLPQLPDNLSRAVDAAVYPVDWDRLEAGFEAIKKADKSLTVLEHFWAMGVVAGIAHMQGVTVRQGFDWNGNSDFADQSFMDMVHTEIPR